MEASVPIQFITPKQLLDNEKIDFIEELKVIKENENYKIQFGLIENKNELTIKVISENGEALTDSAEVLKALVDGTAALAPLGGIGEELAGYKGYGYAAVVEILSAALSGGRFMKALTGVSEDGKPQMYGLGHFFFVVDPDAFVGREEFKKIAGDICRELRASKKAPGEDRIYTAGEKEYDMWLFRKDKGVPVGEGVQKEIIEMRDRLGLEYRFEFEG